MMTLSCLASLCMIVVAAAVWQGSTSLVPYAQKPRENQNPLRGYETARAYWGNYERARPATVEAENAFARGKYTEAESLFRKAISIFPHNAQAMLGLAETCEKQGKQAEALRVYHDLVYPQGWGSNINSSPYTRSKYMMALLRSNRWSEAVAIYELLTRSNLFTNGKPFVERGFDVNRPERSQLQAVGHYILGISGRSWGPAPKNEQIEHLRAAVSLQPDGAQAQLAFGKALENAGKMPAAADAFKKAAAHSAGAEKAAAATGYNRAAGR